MKKLLAALIITCSAATANAQPGSFLLYGNVDFNFYQMLKSSPERVQKGLIMPGMGIQFSNAITVGIIGGYGITSSKLDTASTKRTNVGDWRAGGFVRYSHSLGNIFSFYAQLEAGYRSGNTTYDGDELKGSKYTGIFVGLTPVISVNVKNGFALNFGFGGVNYLTQKYDVPSAKTATQLDITFGQQFNVGVSKNFGGHSTAHKKPAGKMEDDDDAPKKPKKATTDDE